MNFQVLWMQQAIQSLAQAYLSARDDGEAEAVTAAMAEIDHILQANPTTAGESRAGTERFLSIGPMAVEFEVFADERVVVVAAARYVRRRGA
jgi:hypothetical protein